MDGPSTIDDALDSVQSLVTAALVAVRSSFLNFVLAIGVAFLVTSVLLSEHVVPGVSYGILSAMTSIWGASAFVYAGIGKLALRLSGYS